MRLPPRTRLNGDTAVNLQVRAELIQAINQRIAANGWTQAEAAQRLNVSQPRISHLARGQVDRFSVDALLNMAALAGLHIEIAVHHPPS
jgi:predicted XRE-type DNA-binding protein